MARSRKKKWHKEYLYPAFGDDMYCPACGDTCREIHIRDRSVLLDPESRRFLKNERPLALEHTCPWRLK